MAARRATTSPWAGNHHPLPVEAAATPGAVWKKGLGARHTRNTRTQQQADECECEAGGRDKGPNRGSGLGRREGRCGPPTRFRRAAPLLAPSGPRPASDPLFCAVVVLLTTLGTVTAGRIRFRTERITVFFSLSLSSSSSLAGWLALCSDAIFFVVRVVGAIVAADESTKPSSLMACVCQPAASTVDPSNGHMCVWNVE